MDETDCAELECCFLTVLNPALIISVAYDIGQLLSTGLLGDGIIEAAKGLLSDEKSHKRRKILTDLLLNLDDRSELESREKDEDWFKGRKSNRGFDHPHLVYVSFQQKGATMTSKN